MTRTVNAQGPSSKGNSDASAVRDLNPTPEAVFAMYRWPGRYAAQDLGSMGFWDSLSQQERRYCGEAVQAIARANKGKR